MTDWIRGKLEWFVIKHRLYRFMPVSWAGKIIADEPTEEDMQWARRKAKERSSSSETDT